jgi:hypothetical protein
MQDLLQIIFASPCPMKSWGCLGDRPSFRAKFLFNFLLLETSTIPTQHDCRQWWNENTSTPSICLTQSDPVSITLPQDLVIRSKQARQARRPLVDTMSRWHENDCKRLDVVLME